MTLIKTSILSAIATVIKLITGFIVTKIIAVYIGPAGLAIIGNLQNFVSIVFMFSGGFLRTAITKYTAEYDEDKEKKYSLWSSAIGVIAILNIFIFVILFIFSNEISQYLLNNSNYGFILQILAISSPFFALNIVLLSILNGQREIKKYISLTIALSIISLMLVSISSIIFGLKGTLIAYVINQSVVFFITLYFIRNDSWFKLENFLQGLNSKDAKKLFGFAIMAMVAILASDLSLIAIRDFIIDSISLDSAGYWQGAWGLSQISLTLITTSLATYFLPRLSSLKIKNDINKELKKVIIFILPIALFVSLFIYLARDIIIHILYTEKFLPMDKLFLWLMIGNVIKVLGWLFGYVLVARAMVKYTIFIEIVFSVVFVGLVIYFINHYRLIGATYAYSLNSLLYLITVIYIYKFKI